MSSGRTATFKLAVQGSKGTAATTGFHCGVMQSDGFGEMWELAEKDAEHGCAAGSAVYRDKSKRLRTFYKAQGKTKAHLYPNMIGAVMRGLGYADSVSGTTIKTHVFTAAAAGADPYCTALSYLLDDSGTGLERKAVDCKVTQLEISADSKGVTYSTEITGLSMGVAAGTETKTDEPAYAMLPNTGTFTLAYDPAGANTTVLSHSGIVPRSLKMTVSNPVYEDDYGLWSSSLASLNRSEGIRIEGELGGLPCNWTNIYKQFMWNGTSGTAPSPTWVECSLDFKFSAAEIIASATPYSLQVTLPRCEVWLDPDNFDFNGAGDVRWTTKFRAFAGTGTPSTFTLVNSIASY